MTSVVPLEKWSKLLSTNVSATGYVDVKPSRQVERLMSAMIS